MKSVFYSWLHKNEKGDHQLGWNLSSRQRYELTLRTIAENFEAWYLRDGNGDTMTFDFHEKIHVCIWPSKEAARKYNERSGTKDKVRRIPYGELLMTAADLAQDDSYRLAVYPNGEDFWVIEPVQFLTDLKEIIEFAEKAEEDKQ